MRTKAILNKKIDRIKPFSFKSEATLFPTKLLAIRLENGLSLLFEGTKIPFHPEKQGLKVLDKTLVVVNRHSKYPCENVLIKDNKIVDIGFLATQSVENISALLNQI
jgi:hypothetical protein